MKKIFLVFAFFLITIKLFSQETDSLLRLIESEKDKSVKIDLLVELSSAYISDDFEKSIEYGETAYELAGKEENKIKEIEILHFLGKISMSKSLYSKSLEYYTEAATISEEIENDSLLAFSLHKGGNVLLSQSKYNDALQLYIKALDLREKINDIEGIAATTNNIGLIYWNLEQFDKAIEYYRISLENEEKIDNIEGIAGSLNNIGLIYWKAYEQLDTALIYIEKSLELKIQINDVLGVATAYNNLGIISRTKEDYEKAISYFKQSLTIYKEYESNEDISNCYNNIGSVYLKQLNLDSALLFYKKAIIIADSIISYKLLRDAYDGLAVASYNKGDYKNAYDFLDLRDNYKDSLYTQDVADQITEMETKYETEKVEKENEIQKLQLSEEQAKSKIQQYIIAFFAVLLVLIIIFSVALFKLYKDKKQANNELKQLNAEILQQKEEIQAQAENLNEAYQKISLFNEQIKSSIRYGCTIQQAMLPYESTINDLFNNFVIYKPKDIVSGDFYWVNNFEGSRYIAVVDCTGHGVPGAFMSMIGISLLDEIIIAKRILNPKDILEKLNESIILALNQTKTNNTDGMDVCLCKIDDIDNDNFKITYAGAKRDLFYSDIITNSFMKLKGTRRSIGGYKSRNKLPFTQEEKNLKKETKLVLFSDGIVDQNNFKREKFGANRFLKILNNDINNSLIEIKSHLELELHEFQKSEFQRDDITIVGIKL